MGLPVIYAVVIATTDAVKAVGGKGYVMNPKVLSRPVKTGGILTLLIPIFAGISALGALGSGVARIAEAVNAASAAKQQLDNAKKHNKKMEAIALEKGLLLKLYEKGLGLYLNQSKN